MTISLNLGNLYLLYSTIGIPMFLKGFSIIIKLMKIDTLLKVVSFRMEKTGSFSDPLERQIMEGVQINVFNGTTLNRQSA